MKRVSSGRKVSMVAKELGIGGNPLGGCVGPEGVIPTLTFFLPIQIVWNPYIIGER